MSSRREQRRDHPTRPRSGPGRWTADTLPAVARLPVPHGVLLPEPLGFLSPAGPPRRPAGPAVTASSGWGVTTSPCSLSMTKEVPSRRVPLGEVWSSGHFPLWPKLPHIELRPGPQPDRRDWSPESGGPCRLPAQSHPCRGSPPTDAATPTGPWPALRGWTQSHAGYWSRGVPCDRGPRPAGAAGTPSCLLELPPWVASRPQPSMVTAAMCPRHACPQNGHTGRRQRDRGFTARQGPGDRTVSGRGDPFFERASPSSPTGDRGNKVQTS